MNAHFKFMMLSLVLFVQALVVSGCGSQASTTLPIPGIKDIYFYGQDGKAHLSFYLDNLNLNGFGVILPLPKLEGGTVGIAQTKPNEAVLKFELPFRSLAKGKFSKVMGLPDGRPLPESVVLPPGVLPSETLETPVLGVKNITLYLNDDAFGLFVPMPTPVDILATLTFKITDTKGNQIGTASAIPSDIDDKGGGVLFMFPLEF